MAVIETWFEQDLQKPVKVRYIDGNLFSHNGNGNRIGVVVTNNGEAVTLTGTVSGYAVLADGTTVPCTGTRSGNKASILVPAAAYSPGRILISIFLTDGTTVTTLAALSSSVIMARTGNQIDPGSVVTDWTNTINAAMQSVETAAANLGNIVATPYANLTFPVPLGKYTIYNNGLYRCISPIASSEAWTAAHWTNVKLGDEVTELKSAIKPMFSSTIDVEQGYWSIADGAPGNSSNWCRAKNNIPKSVVISVTEISMLLLAFDAKTGNYIGAWNGSTFTNSFNPDTQLYKEFFLSTFSNNYPSYIFKIDFYNSGAALSVESVLSHCTISTEMDMKQNKICNNLVGNVIGVLYPVSLSSGDYLTFSTSDGQPIGYNPDTTKIAFYDANGAFINYYGFTAGLSQRTIGPISQELGNAKYLGIENSPPRVPIMVNKGKNALPYEEYFFTAPETTKKIESLEIISDITKIHRMEHDAVYAVKRHYTVNGSVENAFKALWISDLHKQQKRFNRAVELLNAWGSGYFDIAINTGDTVQYIMSEDLSWYNNQANHSNIPIINTVGNHDAYISLGTLGNKTDVYNNIIAPVASKTTIVQPAMASTNGYNYYYKDINNVIRLVVLDCMFWDNDQLTWFESVLASAKTDSLPVIVCTHAPFDSQYCKLIDSVWNVGFFKRDTVVTSISAAEAVKSFMDNGGTFICWLTGHIHGDEISILPNYGNQLVLCTNTFEDRGTTCVKNEDDTAYNYDCLTFVTVDTTAGLIKLFRIGANIDTSGHMHNGFSWNYNNNELISDY